MLSTFFTLKSLYASREITMEDLEQLQQYDFIRLENRGISRSERDCLLCEVRCEPFENFLKTVTSVDYESTEALCQAVRGAGLGLESLPCADASLLTFYNENKCVEIVASVKADGRVSIDPDDIEVEPFFRVYLRVQGM